MDSKEDNKEDKADKEDNKLQLICSNLEEVLGSDELKNILDYEDNPVAYWGVAPTRSPSIGYLIPLLKICDLVRAGIYVKILIADLHSWMDKGHTTYEKTPQRVAYYKFILSTLLSYLQITSDKYEFVLGSDLQLDKKYNTDLLRMSSHITINQAKKAGSEVVKQDKDPRLSSLLYPLMQALDQQAIGAHIQLGGVDQRKIFAFAIDNSKRFHMSSCCYLLNPLLPSLGKPDKNAICKMSSSDPMSKLDFFDDTETIDVKIKRAYCVEGCADLKTSPCLAIFKHILFPLGLITEYPSYEELVEQWKAFKITSQELKALLAKKLDQLIDPIRTQIKSNNLYNEAF